MRTEEEQTALVEELQSGPESCDDRSVVPVRVFWLPAPDRGRVAKLAGLFPGRDPYHPNLRQQRHILRTDPTRARIVAGEAAKVSELSAARIPAPVEEDLQELGAPAPRLAVIAVTLQRKRRVPFRGEPIWYMTLMSPPP